jgi:hypothetical protein
MSTRASVLAVMLLVLTGIALLMLLVERGKPEQNDAISVDASAPTPVEEGNAVPAAQPPPEPRVAEVAEPPAIDWMRRYQYSTDDFALARDLVASALHGNSRAEYLLRGVLLRCEVQKRSLARYPAESLAARLELHLDTLPHTPDWIRAKHRREALRCERLVAEDPFEGYEVPEEARDFRYWSNLALESGDALAVMDHAYRLVASRPSSDDVEKDRAFREALTADVRVAVSSRDPAALAAVGGVFSNPSIVANPEAGFAWQVAACELGFDCSLAKPDWGFGCVESGACLPGQTWLDNMQRDLGPAKYAAVYAKSQDIRYKLETGDWDGLQQYLQIK